MSHILKNKKAISGVVTSVLLILIAITAISLISIYLMKTVNSPKLSSQVSCLDMQTSSVLKIKSVCFNSSSRQIQISLQRIADIPDINQFNIVLSSNNKSGTWCCGTTCEHSCLVLDKGAQKTYYLNNTENATYNTAQIAISSCEIDKRALTSC